MAWYFSRTQRLWLALFVPAFGTCAVLGTFGGQKSCSGKIKGEKLAGCETCAPVCSVCLSACSIPLFSCLNVPRHCPPPPNPPRFPLQPFFLSLNHHDGLTHCTRTVVFALLLSRAWKMSMLHYCRRLFPSLQASETWYDSKIIKKMFFYMEITQALYFLIICSMEKKSASTLTLLHVNIWMLSVARMRKDGWWRKLGLPCSASWDRLIEVKFSEHEREV